MMRDEPRRTPHFAHALAQEVKGNLHCIEQRRFGAPPFRRCSPVHGSAFGTPWSFVKPWRNGRDAGRVSPIPLRAGLDLAAQENVDFPETVMCLPLRWLRAGAIVKYFSLDTRPRTLMC